MMFSAFFRVAGNGFQSLRAEFWKDLPPDFDLLVESTDGRFNNSLSLERRLLPDSYIRWDQVLQILRSNVVNTQIC